jgi:hypothetical protein
MVKFSKSVRFHMASHVAIPNVVGSHVAVEYAGIKTNTHRREAIADTLHNMRWYFKRITPSKFHLRVGPDQPLFRVPVPGIPSRPCGYDIRYVHNNHVRE